jgi:hypothetical protein
MTLLLISNTAVKHMLLNVEESITKEVCGESAAAREFFSGSMKHTAIYVR